MRTDRFVVTYSKGTLDIVQILVDKETGVNYLYRKTGYAGGLAPLLDKDGKPVVTDITTLR